jgi:hypothetical protein
LDGTTRSKLQNLHFSLSRLVALFCIDTDLAVLIFCEVSQTIEACFLAQSFTPDTSPVLRELQANSFFCKEESLSSGQQVALISSTCRGLSRPGYQGPTGLKANIHDICTHSVGDALLFCLIYYNILCLADLSQQSSYMMIKVFKLAAKVFPSQAYNNFELSDMKRAVEMSAGLDNCLQTPQVLQSAFVPFREAP